MHSEAKLVGLRGYATTGLRFAAYVACRWPPTFGLSRALCESPELLPKQGRLSGAAPDSGPQYVIL